jgi:iron(III) transport system permease protein
VLIILPMTWLVYYSFVDRDGTFTLENFARLATDPTFVDPLITTVIISTSSSVICCAFAALMGWLVARSDMPLGNVVRALVTASFVTPPFLGAIAWELLAAPNSGLINKAWRALTGAEMDTYLLNIYTLPGLIFVISCYTFPYVFVLIANALDRIPGDLEDASSILGGRAWTTARRVTIPLAMPALLAGALIAFLQSMTLFGSPAILALPAGFHTMTTKIWSLFQFPPKLELAAAASLPLLVLTIVLLRAESMVLGRRGYSVVGGKQGNPRLVPLGALRWVALGFVFLVLALPIFLPYAALINAAFSRVASQFIWFDNFTFQNFDFVFFQLSATKLAVKNTFILGMLAATIGTILAVVISYVTSRKAIAGHRALGFLATAPVAIPGIVLGVGLFLSYARPPFVLYGTLWILLIAFVTIALPAALPADAVGVPLGARRSRGGGPHPRRYAAAHAVGHHGAAAPYKCDRDLVLHLRRRHARALRCGHSVHVGDQGDLGAHLRSEGIGRSRRHRGAGARPVGHHLRGRGRGQPRARPRRRPSAAESVTRNQ